MKNDGYVVFNACPKCDQIILEGRESGVKFRLSTLTIPVEPAKCLADWGVAIYIVREFNHHLMFELWDKGMVEPEWLVIEHECTRDRLNWRFHKPDYRRRIPRYRTISPPPVRGFTEDEPNTY